MQKTFLRGWGVALVLLFSGQALAVEADYFSRRIGYPDSRILLNQKMNEALMLIGENSRDCDELHLHRDVMASLGGFVIAPIERWGAEFPGSFTPKFNESIYSGLGAEAPFARWGCCGTTMRVGDTLISSDKLGHFLHSGFEMYFIVRSKTEFPIRDVRDFWSKVADLWESPVAGPPIEAVMTELGIRDRKLTVEEVPVMGPRIAGMVSHFQETSAMGAASTAVKSYGDMAANYGGYLFWSRLIHGPNPYFTCRVGKWHLNREFKWTDFITDAWDEAINCNEYSTPRMKQVVTKRIAELAYQNAWPSQTCPIVPAKCKGLAAKYGEVSNYILHPDCRNQKIDNIYENLLIF